MPELAEVEFFRRRWWAAGARQTVRAAETNPRSRVYRSLAKELPGGAAALAKILAGAKLADSATHGKQMWFVFKVGTPLSRQGGIRSEFPISGRHGGRPSGRATHGRLGEASLPEFLWLGIHLGMTGALRVEPVDYRAQKHDAILLRLARRTLVFNDPRQFGRVRTWVGPTRARPPWLENLPDEILSPEFTVEFVQKVWQRHARAPLKAVLLDQKYFPGIGNWMADEILWRAALHPALRAGRAADLRTAKKLRATIQRVARDALRVIAGAGGKIPAEHNDDIPQSWLFHHRWEDGGKCPKAKRLLKRAEIGGRTTCWSPARQKRPRQGGASATRRG